MKIGTILTNTFPYHLILTNTFPYHLKDSTMPNKFPKEPLDIVKDALIYDDSIDILLAPEWFLNASGRAFSKSEFEDLEFRITDLSSIYPDKLLIPGSVVWHQNNYLFNTAFISSFGKTQKYFKKTSGGDSIWENSSEIKFFPHYNQGKFAWKNYNVGLEICADHEIKTLKEDLNFAFDLQIVISCSMSLRDYAITVVDKGLVMICDGYLNYSGVFQIEHCKDFSWNLNPNFNWLAAESSETVLNNNVRYVIYEVETLIK